MVQQVGHSKKHPFQDVCKTSSVADPVLSCWPMAMAHGHGHDGGPTVPSPQRCLARLSIWWLDGNLARSPRSPRSPSTKGCHGNHHVSTQSWPSWPSWQPIAMLVYWRVSWVLGDQQRCDLGSFGNLNWCQSASTISGNQGDFGRCEKRTRGFPVFLHAIVAIVIIVWAFPVFEDPKYPVLMVYLIVSPFVLGYV